MPDGNDTITLTSGSITGNVDWGAGDETGDLDLSEVTLTGNLVFGTGSDDFRISRGRVDGNIYLGDENQLDFDDPAEPLMLTRGLSFVPPTQTFDDGSVGENNRLVLDEGVVTGSVFGDDSADRVYLAGGTVGGSVILGAGADLFEWSKGVLTGGFSGGVGSDTVVISASEFDGSQTLAGGDDVSAIDGWTDQLTFENLNVSVTGARLTGWESIIVDGGAVALADGSLTVGSFAGAGVRVTGGGSLDLGANATLRGNLTLDPTARLIAGDEGDGSLVVTGSVANSGAITLSDQGTGDRMAVAGDYAGAGALVIDVDTASDTADTVEIAGNSTGTTEIALNNLSPVVATGNAFRLVTVGQSSSAGDFRLAGAALTAGAFDYDLSYNAGGFDLTPVMNSAGAVYAAFPNLAAVYTQLPTLRQRMGQRATSSAPQSPAGRGAWAAPYYDRFDISSATGGDVSATQSGLRIGYDAALETAADGQWVIGMVANVGRQRATVQQNGGSATVKSDGIALAATATRQAGDGSYLDLQGQAARLESTFAAGSGGSLAKDVISQAYSASVELGKKVEVAPKHSVGSHARLAWTKVNGTNFIDDRGNSVALGPDTALLAKVGSSYEYKTRSNTTGRVSSFYATGSLLVDFMNGSEVNVAGATLATETPGQWFEIGLGGAVALGKHASLTGEASTRVSPNKGDATFSGLSASIGLQFVW